MKEARLRGTHADSSLFACWKSCLGVSAKYAEAGLFLLYLGNMKKSFWVEMAELQITKVTLRGILAVSKEMAHLDLIHNLGVTVFT